MSGLTAAVLFGLVVLKLTDLVKAISAKQWQPIKVQLISFVLGFGVVVVGAHANLDISVGDIALKTTNTAAQLLIGLVVMGLAGTGYDLKRAIDNTDSAATNYTTPPPPTA